MKIGDMQLEIHKTWYNKTRVQEDGITHVVDPKQYTAYQFGMAKNYMDADDKSKADITKEIIKDLRDVANHLERMIEQEKSQEKDEKDL